MSDFNTTRLYADIADRDDLIEQQQARIAELESNYEELAKRAQNKYREPFEREKNRADALAAHVERCNVDTDKAIELLSLIRESGVALHELEEPLHNFLINYKFAESPQTSLAERDAEVVERFIDGELRSACISRGWDTDSSAYQVHLMLEQYASQLREQSK